MKSIFKIFIIAIFTIGFIYTPAFADNNFYDKVAKEAEARTKLSISYVPDYVKIDYPMGDVPADTGVCADVIVRVYRKMGIDLQQLVHEDMKANFSKYPKYWGLKSTDKNIDHRRVLNLEVFFARHGEKLPITKKAKDYKAGDIVSWNLREKGSLPHIGIVSSKKASNGNPLIVHNIGIGPELSDILFEYKITGHFRYKK